MEEKDLVKNAANMTEMIEKAKLIAEAETGHVKDIEVKEGEILVDVDVEVDKVLEDDRKHNKVGYFKDITLQDVGIYLTKILGADETQMEQTFREITEVGLLSEESMDFDRVLYNHKRFFITDNYDFYIQFNNLCKAILEDIETVEELEVRLSDLCEVHGEVLINRTPIGRMDLMMIIEQQTAKIIMKHAAKTIESGDEMSYSDRQSLAKAKATNSFFALKFLLNMPNKEEIYKRDINPMILLAQTRLDQTEKLKNIDWDRVKGLFMNLVGIDNGTRFTKLLLSHVIDRKNKVKVWKDRYIKLLTLVMFIERYELEQLAVMVPTLIDMKEKIELGL